MKQTIAQLKDWLVKHRPFYMARLEKDEAYPSRIEESLAELPPDIAEQLTQLTKKLVSHPRDQQVIQEAVIAAVKEWKENPNSVNNSLIILSSPVAIVARVLTDSLADWSEQQSLAINFLDWVERPPSPENIKSKMNEALEITGPEHKEKNIAVISNLSWCFLRSSEGLDGIDYLRDYLLSDRTQFWIIGSGQVAWQYLNSILNLQAYSGNVIQLPRLSGEQLQGWLMPIIDQLNIQFDDESIQERLQDVRAENSYSPFKALTALLTAVRTSVKFLFRMAKKELLTPKLTGTNDGNEGSSWADYFERLSDLSEGVSTIALQLFIKSIRYEELSEEKLVNEVQDTEEIESLLDPDPPPMHRLVVKMPRLLNLPELEQNDLYILYSLLIHDDLTLEALSESVGEEQSTTNSHVQVLRRKGVIEQQGQVMKVNPIHFPQLKKQLASENFIVKVAD